MGAKDCHIKTSFYHVQASRQARQTVSRLPAGHFRPLGEENQGTMRYFSSWTDPGGEMAKK
jgi:hypothetical protein